MTSNEILIPKGNLREMLENVRDGKAVSVFGMRGYARMIASAKLHRFVYVCADISKKNLRRSD